MAKLTYACSICAKQLRLVKSYKIEDGLFLNSYECGHTFTQRQEDRKHLVLHSVDNTKFARNYQGEGVDFTVNPPEGNLGGPFNCIIADQMRLGKTPQSLMALASDYKNRTPCLIIVGGANLWQWIREYQTWCDSLPNGIYPIIGTKGWIPPGFSAYIISRDTFSRMGTCTTCKHGMNQHGEGPCTNKKCKCTLGVDAGDSMVAKLLKFGFKLAIVDELHSFKNMSSARSQALVKFLHDINESERTVNVDFSCFNCSHKWTQAVKVKTDAYASKANYRGFCEKCNAINIVQSHLEHVDMHRNCGFIGLSGTNVKNRADEYFLPLNIVAPTVFPSLANFRTRWCIADNKGQYSRIHPDRLEDFRRTIAPYVLRREKEDVYKDLPAINRMFTVMEVEDEQLKKTYNKVLDSIEARMDRGNYTYFDSIGELSLLRQICGIAKVEWACEYVDEYLSDEDRIVVGIHHHSLRDILLHKLSNYGVWKLDGSDSNERKDFVMRKFKDSPERVNILGMQAAKEGLEFYYIKRALVLERMWSSADEEQFEFRFYNPDKDFLEAHGVDRNKSTEIEYAIAKGTIDEFFYDLVEQKRAIFGETVSNNWDLTKDADSFRSLLERTVGARL